MIIVDTALQAREAEGRPIRVAMHRRRLHGPGTHQPDRQQRPGHAHGRGLQPPRPERARHVRLCRPRTTPSSPNTQDQVEDAIRAGKPVVTEDAFLLARSEQIDVLVDVTGSVEFGARVVLEAFKHGKDVVLMNAEIDATIGPILQMYAEKYGRILSACDGDEPGVQMNLYRWVKGLGLIAPRHGQHQGTAGSLSQSDHAEGLRREVGAESGDGHQLRRRLEDQLRAGDRRQRHRLRGASRAACRAASNIAATS